MKDQSKLGSVDEVLQTPECSVIKQYTRLLEHEFNEGDGERGPEQVKQQFIAQQCGEHGVELVESLLNFLNGSNETWTIDEAIDLLASKSLSDVELYNIFAFLQGQKAECPTQRGKLRVRIPKWMPDLKRMGEPIYWAAIRIYSVYCHTEGLAHLEKFLGRDERTQTWQVTVQVIAEHLKYNPDMKLSTPLFDRVSELASKWSDPDLQCSGENSAFATNLILVCLLNFNWETGVYYARNSKPSVQHLLSNHLRRVPLRKRHDQKENTLQELADELKRL